MKGVDPQEKTFVEKVIIISLKNDLIIIVDYRYHIPRIFSGFMATIYHSLVDSGIVIW